MTVMPIQIAVCDDDPNDLNEIITLTQKICIDAGIRTVTTGYENTETLLSDIQSGCDFHLLLIDVLLPRFNGMQFARTLRKTHPDLPIIFISCNREMALQGYEVAALRYLAKPLREDRLKEALLFCIQNLPRKDSILLPFNTIQKKVSLIDICYFEIAGRKTRVVQPDGSFLTSLSLRELTAQLHSDGFIQCHRSFLVNCRFIRTLNTSFLELTTGEQIPVSKHRVKEVRSAFFSYMDH